MNLPDKQQRNARFWRKFLRLTRGRVPVLRTLEVVAGEENDAAFRAVISSIKEAMEQGTSMSQALRKYPSEFSASVIELVGMAEKSGAWDEILREIVDGLSEGTFE
ncbi:MAG: hypothetical protein A2283_00375 [Lentisphaerae bacterium RIFOXYA12_FULL_48_11]|nr:MAG: hypothetical protein A2283_00375 [Lentisphaerae bacterium RIFOXYA12_FULL_48_11]